MDNQARLDAMADMMTLSYLAIESHPSTRYYDFFGAEGLVSKVGIMLQDLSDANAGVRYSASIAARQAFAICPGLR